MNDRNKKIVDSPMTRIVRIGDTHSPAGYSPFVADHSSLGSTANGRSLAGFTLIEALVAVAVFAMTVTSMVGMFLAILRLDQKSRAIRLVEQQARFLSEFITREIRNNTLDYSNYDCVPPGSQTACWPESALYVLTSDDPPLETIYLYHDGTRGAVWLDKGSASSEITGAEVDVRNLYFYIYPQSNPPDDQPRVTFTFTITSRLGVRPADQASLTFQTTVSSREYQ